MTSELVKNRLLLVSLTANLLLGGGLFLATRQVNPTTPARTMDLPGPATNGGIASIPPGAEAAKTFKPITPAFDWRQVESEDYKKYIANLRAVGCPEETIRDIILADVNKLFAARRKALQPPAGGFQFWKSGSAGNRAPDEERMAKIQSLAREKRDLLRELLGVDVVDPNDALAAIAGQFTDMLDFLPPDRQALLVEMEQRHAARLAKFAGQTNATALAGIRELQAEKEAELAQLLSPAERETYQLITSHTASVMRNQLGDFNPNEQEFRDVFKARKRLDEAYRELGDAKDPATRDGREAALLKAYDEIRQALGDARWIDYRSAREWTASSPLRQAAEAAGIPKIEALKVADIRDEARREALGWRANPALSPDQLRQAQLAAQARAIAEITRVLGTQAAAAYLANPATQGWIGDLAVHPKP